MTNQPLQFRQPSLRETIVDALAFIGVQDYSDFNLKKNSSTTLSVASTMLATSIVS